MKKFDEFTDFIVDQLSAFGEVAPRKMFGGVGLFHQGLMFGLIAKGELYFKADNLNRKRYDAAGLPPFRPYPEREAVMQYYLVPPDVLEDRESLAEWAYESYEAALRKKKKKHS